VAPGDMPTSTTHSIQSVVAQERRGGGGGVERNLAIMHSKERDVICGAGEGVGV